MTSARATLSYKGKETPLPQGETLIGSGSKCAIRLEGTGVAPVHAAITVDGEKVTLHDRSPDQETKVNDQRASVVGVEVGSKLTFGEVALEVNREGTATVLQGAAGTFPLATGENKVGRAPDCRVQLEDASISRYHATILVLPKRVLVKDLNSTNGTTVEGRPVGSVELSSGDRLKLGDQELTYEFASATPQGSGGPVLFHLLIDGNSRILSPGELKIGRAPDCKISFDDDAGISRYHAQLTVESNAVRLRDLGSSNGTFVNGSQIGSEVTLANGDRITLGEHELVLQAKGSVDPLGKTVLASDLKGLTEKTVLMTKGAASKAAASQAKSSGAWAVLDLPMGSSEKEIRQKYQELFSEYQVRLTNAPTPKLKEKYNQKLEDLRAAFAELVPDAAGAAASDLPSSKPVAVPRDETPRPSPAAPQKPVASRGSAAKKEPQRKVKAAELQAESSTEPESAKKSLPKSALVMVGLGVLVLGFAITMLLLLLAAKRKETTLSATLVEKQQSIERMQQEIVDTQQALDNLQTGKATLLENRPFKVCNLSTEGSLRVLWLAAAYIDSDDQMASFDSSSVGYHKWTINAGGSLKFDFVRDDRVIWDGSALFFSMLFKHRGKEYFRSGSMHNLPDDCYMLALDDVS